MYKMVLLQTPPIRWLNTNQAFSFLTMLQDYLNLYVEEFPYYTLISNV